MVYDIYIHIYMYIYTHIRIYLYIVCICIHTDRYIYMHSIRIVWTKCYRYMISHQAEHIRCVHLHCVYAYTYVHTYVHNFMVFGTWLYNVMNVTRLQAPRLPPARIVRTVTEPWPAAFIRFMVWYSRIYNNATSQNRTLWSIMDIDLRKPCP